MFAASNFLTFLAEDGAYGRRLSDGRGFALSFGRHEQLVAIDTFERLIVLGFVEADADGIFRITPAGRAQVRYAPHKAGGGPGLAEAASPSGNSTSRGPLAIPDD